MKKILREKLLLLRGLLNSGLTVLSFVDDMVMIVPETGELERISNLIGAKV